MIQIRCTCGNSSGVSDALAGKTIRCSRCGELIKVGAPKPSGPTQAMKRRKETPAISISPGQIRAMSVIGGVILLVAIFYFGPVRTWHQWNQLEPTASNQVKDVILFGLEAYLSEHGKYDPAFQHLAPQIDEEVHFFPPVLSMSMPEKLAFLGKTNEGNYGGTYDTRTGDIQANVEYGGYSVAGLVDVKQAPGSFQMTGREIDGVPAAEVNGISLRIISHPHHPGEE